MKVKAVAAAFALMGFGLSLVALCTSSGSIKHVNKARRNIPVITIPSLECDFWPNRFALKEEEEDFDNLPEFIEPI